LKVLVINCGSSSLKYELMDTAAEKSLASGLCQRVGIDGGVDATIEHRPAEGEPFELAEAFHRVQLF